MGAYSNEYPWPPHYGHFKFFEERMEAHSRVKSVKELQSGLYELTLLDQRTLRVFICECYSYGIAEYYETVSKLGKVDAVIINSNWCGYTDEAKFHCRDLKIGLFDIRDFMAALNKPKLWLYLNSFQDERYKKAGLIK